MFTVDVKQQHNLYSDRMGKNIRHYFFDVQWIFINHVKHRFCSKPLSKRCFRACCRVFHTTSSKDRHQVV